MKEPIDVPETGRSLLRLLQLSQLTRQQNQLRLLLLEFELGSKEVEITGRADSVLFPDGGKALAHELHRFLRHQRVVTQLRQVKTAGELIAGRSPLDEFLPQFPSFRQRA